MRSAAPKLPDARAETLSARSTRPALELFLVSFLALFFELAWIRWLGSTVIFLTYFTNVVLMACFLGLSVGCIASARRYSWMNTFVPLSLCAATSAAGFLWIYERFGQVMVEVGSQQSPQVIYFGAELRSRDFSKWVIPIELLAGYFFGLVALVFVGLGQEMGRRFSVIENRLIAYSVDILGSLTGIVAFGLMSYFRLPAYCWFSVSMALGWCFVRRRRWLHALGGLIVVALIFAPDFPRDAFDVDMDVVWSPYYQVRFKPRFMSIDVNNIGHQGMQRVDAVGGGYHLPYLLNRDAGGKPFEDVLIIGAGSGNDVAAALAEGARHVDAAEIDPVLYDLGRRHHPNRPYSDPRVTIRQGDGRSFLRTTTAKYDVIIYAVVDSLALHTSYSSVRLESFLFTEGAFGDIKAALKPGGVFVLYNFYRQGWLVCRLAALCERVFGSPPLVLSIPMRAAISPEDNLRGYATYLIAGDESSKAKTLIRAKFAAQEYFRFYRQPRFSIAENGFGPSPRAAVGAPEPEPVKVGSAKVARISGELIPTDDWPFLYLRQAEIPALNLRGIAVVGVLSLIILALLAPIRRVRPSATMFFLGAGFMLLETKGVVHMALLFGSTWVVNSIVFFAILSMILVSNLLVTAMRPKRLWPYYLSLLAALLSNLLVAMDTYLALPGASKIIVSCLVVFLPVFFAGVIFAMLFRSSTQPQVDFGSNVGGIILGGLTEYLSLIFGFNSLIGIAIGYYVLSAVFARRKPILPIPA
jgi:SAM-dependent methyltransferase